MIVKNEVGWKPITEQTELDIILGWTILLCKEKKLLLWELLFQS